jgi:hypothetical protein
MTVRKLLVVATAPVDGEALRRAVREHLGDDEAEVRIVAPAADLSPLEWLASDEDEAREEAARLAGEASEALDEDAPVETEVGDPDPAQAIEDALRTYEADELVLVGPPESDVGWLEQGNLDEAVERLGLPVTRLVTRAR